MKIELAGLAGQEQEYVIIDNKDGSQTSMLKSEYDKQQAEQSTPMVLDEAPSK
jgi:hypothetical protein